jgi:sacsin
VAQAQARVAQAQTQAQAQAQGQAQGQAQAQRAAEAAHEDAAPPPDEFVCPITREVMDDPVLAVDGHTYERAAIESWFRQSMARPPPAGGTRRFCRSPKTNQELRSTAVIANHAIRSQILQWAETHGV